MENPNSVYFTNEMASKVKRNPTHGKPPLRQSYHGKDLEISKIVIQKKGRVPVPPQTEKIGNLRPRNISPNKTNVDYKSHVRGNKGGKISSPHPNTRIHDPCPHTLPVKNNITTKKVGAEVLHREHVVNPTDQINAMPNTHKHELSNGERVRKRSGNPNRQYPDTEVMEPPKKSTIVQKSYPCCKRLGRSLNLFTNKKLNIKLPDYGKEISSKISKNNHTKLRSMNSVVRCNIAQGDGGMHAVKYYGCDIITPKCLFQVNDQKALEGRVTRHECAIVQLRQRVDVLRDCSAVSLKGDDRFKFEMGTSPKVVGEAFAKWYTTSSRHILNGQWMLNTKTTHNREIEYQKGSRENGTCTPNAVYIQNIERKNLCDGKYLLSKNVKINSVGISIHWLLTTDTPLIREPPPLVLISGRSMYLKSISGVCIKRDKKARYTPPWFPKTLTHKSQDYNSRAITLKESRIQGTGGPRNINPLISCHTPGKTKKLEPMSIYDQAIVKNIRIIQGRIIIKTARRLYLLNTVYREYKALTLVSITIVTIDGKKMRVEQNEKCVCTSLKHPNKCIQTAVTVL